MRHASLLMASPPPSFPPVLPLHVLRHRGHVRDVGRTATGRESVDAVVVRSIIWCRISITDDLFIQNTVRSNAPLAL